MFRVWALAGGYPGPGPGPADAAAGSVRPGRRACSPGGSDAGNHTCHGGLWCHLSAQNQDRHPGSGLAGGQPVPPVPAHSPVGSSLAAGWGAGPEGAGPEKGYTESHKETSYQHLGTLLSVATVPRPPTMEFPAAGYSRDGKVGTQEGSF